MGYYISTCMSKWHNSLYIHDIYLVYIHVHMQVLSDDGHTHPIHQSCPFPLHCSPICVALSKGSVLIILVILSFVMSVLPADSDQEIHAAHGFQATLFQDRCHHIRCSQSEQGAAALLKYIPTQSHI